MRKPYKTSILIYYFYSFLLSFALLILLIIIFPLYSSNINHYILKFSKPSDFKIVIVTIDKKTTDETLLDNSIKTVEIIKKFTPRIIGFDILFTQKKYGISKISKLNEAALKNNKEKIPIVLVSDIDIKNGKYVEPVDELRKAGFYVGYSNFTKKNNHIWKYQFSGRFTDENSFAYSMIQASGSALTDYCEKKGWTDKKLQEENHINYIGGSTQEQFPVISYIDLLNNRLPEEIQNRWKGKVKNFEELFAGKFVVFGVPEDKHYDPWGNLVLGVGVHAAALDMLLHEANKVNKEAEPGIIFLIFSLIVIITIFLSSRKSILFKTICLIFVLFGYILLVILFFDKINLFLPFWQLVFCCFGFILLTEWVTSKINADFLLINSAANGDAHAIELLINQNKNVNVRDDCGQTALMIAAEKGHLEIVTLLLSNKKTSLIVQNNLKQTALEIAVENGNIKIANLLVQNDKVIKWIIDRLENKDWFVRFKTIRIIERLEVTDSQLLNYLKQILENESDEFIKEEINFLKKRLNI